MLVHAMNMYMLEMLLTCSCHIHNGHVVNMLMYMMDMLIPSSRNEVHLIRISGLIRTLTTSFNFGVSLSLYVAITFVTFVKTGGTLTPRRVIVTLSLLNFLRTVGATFLIRAIFLLFEAKVALKRMQV